MLLSHTARPDNRAVRNGVIALGWDDGRVAFMEVEL